MPSAVRSRTPEVQSLQTTVSSINGLSRVGSDGPNLSSEADRECASYQHILSLPSDILPSACLLLSSEERPWNCGQARISSPRAALHRGLGASWHGAQTRMAGWGILVGSMIGRGPDVKCSCRLNSWLSSVWPNAKFHLVFYTPVHDDNLDSAHTFT